MSITGLNNPSGFVSLQDDLWHVAISNKQDEINFKYVFDIHDGSGVQQIRAKIYPEPSDGKGYFNASNVVKNLITYNWFLPTTNTEAPNNTALTGLQYVYNKVPSTSGEIATSYQIRVGEDYVSGGIQITDIGLASGTISAYNYLPKLFGRRKFTLDQKENFYLSNRPRWIKIDRDKVNHLFIGAMAEEYDPGSFIAQHYLRVYLYDGAWNQIDYMTFTESTPNNRVYQLDISPKSISDTQNIANSAQDDPYVDYITVSGQTKYIELIYRLNNDDKITLELDCYRNPDATSLHFINSYGVFETAIFTGANKLSMDIERKPFERNEYKFNNGAVEYYDINNVYFESKINYSQLINHTYRLIYEYPNDAEYAWLAELVYSPLIYMEKDGNFYPVTIKNTNYQYNQVRFDSLKNLELEVEVNQKRKGFLR
jgi:hypothetical protein